MSPPGLQGFLASQEGRTSGIEPPPLLWSSLVANTRISISAYDIRVVIVDRSAKGSGPVVDLFNEVLGPPNVSAGQFSEWVIRPSP
jgi:hypothetical protein